MCGDKKFLLCKHCGNLVGVIHDSGAKIVCCGDPMTELEANTVEASAEKHLPVIEAEGTTITVKVGSVAHPMVPEHYIGWVYLLTEQGGQRKCLEVGKEPEVTFSIADGDKVLAAFAYCNLHGLWRTNA